MEIIAKYNYVNSSVQKICLLANLIRGKKTKDALKDLKFIKKKSSLFLIKVINSAIANAKNNYFCKEENYIIKKIYINKGPSIKRILPRAKGRTDSILKRTSHIIIIISY